MVVYPHNQKAEIAFVRLELKVRSAVSKRRYNRMTSRDSRQTWTLLQISSYRHHEQAYEARRYHATTGRQARCKFGKGSNL